jgi:hypothetical protein
MNKLGYVLFKNENVIGIFDDEQILNTYIDGCIQNNFFNRDNIKIEKYTMNSLFCHNKDKLTKIINTIEVKKSVESNKDQVEKKLPVESEKKIDFKELCKNENYKKIIQDKIDIKHEINELKQKKKKIEESKITYDVDIKLYDKFKNEKEKQSSFVIPEIFNLKYELFEKLETTNKLSFDEFYNEWEKIKPKNNYSMFGSNSYEDSFVENAPEVINIEMDI